MTDHSNVKKRRRLTNSIDINYPYGSVCLSRLWLLDIDLNINISLLPSMRRFLSFQSYASESAKHHRRQSPCRQD